VDSEAVEVAAAGDSAESWSAAEPMAIDEQVAARDHTAAGEAVEVAAAGDSAESSKVAEPVVIDDQAAAGDRTAAGEAVEVAAAGDSAESWSAAEAVAIDEQADDLDRTTPHKVADAGAGDSAESWDTAERMVVVEPRNVLADIEGADAVVVTKSIAEGSAAFRGGTDDGRVDGDGWPAGSQGFAVIASMDDRPVERPVMDPHAIDASTHDADHGDTTMAAPHSEPAAE
jgi:hypothetical protein